MLNLTRLLLYLSLVLVVAASGHHRRGHTDFGRLMKRAPLDILGTPQGQQAASASASASASAPASPTPPSSQVTTPSAQTTPANSVSVQATSASTNPSSSGGGLSSSLVGSLVPTQSSTTLSAPTATSTATSPLASSDSSVDPQTSAHATNTPTTTPPQSILYLSSSSTPTPTPTSSSPTSSGISHAAVTVLIVIAASVGAAVIVWTIIRKWKFRPSSDFEGRMQPIDWQPGGNDEDAGPSGQRRPLSHASSFHSGSGTGHVDDQMRGPYSSSLNPIPDHDFTAGPAHLAPVGGYADLARGLSSQPMMQESFGVAPSINRPMQYDQPGVPLYHGYNGY